MINATLSTDHNDKIPLLTKGIHILMACYITYSFRIAEMPTLTFRKLGEFK